MMTDNRIIDAVHRVTRTLSSTLEHQEGLRRTLQIAAECVDATGGSLWQHDPQKRQLVCRYVIGERENELVGFTLADTEGIAGDVFQSCRARSDTKLGQDPQHAHRVD